MSIRLKLSILLCVLFLISMVNAILSLQMEKYGDEHLDKVNQTHDMLYTSEKLLGAMKDAETGQRGYLLTGDSSYLAPYYTGTDQAEGYLNRLIQLSSSQPEQRQRLEQVVSTVNAKIQELQTTIVYIEEGERQAALDIVSNNSGKQLMDRIRALLAEFNNIESLRLEENRGQLRASRARIFTLITVEIVLLIALAVITIAFLQKSFFHPLKRLLESAHKVESGERVDIIDVLHKDELGHLLATFYQMSEQVHQRHQNLDAKAKHDELTGLKNRVSLSEYLTDAIDATKKSGGHFAVFYLDLNNFKEINDTYGHDTGDHVLQTAAARLTSVTRSGDTLFRLGGDEFLILARSITSADDATLIAEKIVNVFKEPVFIDGNSLILNTSIGFTLCPDDTESEKELIKFSDLAMYMAKRRSDSDYSRFERGMLRRADDS